MAERPQHEHGPQRPATIYLPTEMWRTVKSHALLRGVTASAILAELISDYLDTGPDAQAALAERAAKWMRPKGGAARGDGDGDSP